MNSSLLPFQKLDSYIVAKELAKRTHEAGIRDCELRDQATRAAKSTFLGLCEGLPSDASGIRRRHFDIANNSLHELIGAVDLADAIGAVDSEVASELMSLAVRVKRMLRMLRARWSARRSDRRKPSRCRAPWPPHRLPPRRPRRTPPPRTPRHARW